MEVVMLVHPQLTEQIIGAAIEVHRHVGSGLLLKLKSIEAIEPIHEAQLLTYLRLSRLRVGLLISFNTPLLKDGIVRRVR